MNILFLIGKYPNIGGVETVTTILANEFSKQGHKVHVISFEQTIPDLDTGINPEVLLWKLSYPVYSSYNKNKLKEIVNTNNIEIIINQWCIPYFVTRLCKKAIKGTGCKLIAVHHNLPNKNSRIVDCEIALEKNINAFIFKKILIYLKLNLLKLISSLNLKLVYRDSDQFVVLSKSFKNVFLKFALINNPNKLKSIPNPITIPENYIPQKKEKTIIYVGRIDYNQKRVIRIVKIWEKVFRVFPDWKLKIVGDGPEKEKLEAFVVRENIKNLSFEGFQSPIEYYKKASILLLTSEYEGFGLVVLEGMKFGVVPIVYGSYPAIHDIVENNKTGFITRIPYSEKEIIKYLKYLMQNEETLKTMSNQAIIQSSKFALDVIVSKWNNLFDSLN